MGRHRGRRRQRRLVRRARGARARGGVLVLEKADPAWSGGNSSFTAGAIRLAHGGLDDLRDVVEADERPPPPTCPRTRAEDFLADLRRVTLGRGDERWRDARRGLRRGGPLAARSRAALPAHVRAPGVRGRRPPPLLGRPRDRHRRRRRGPDGPAPGRGGRTGSSCATAPRSRTSARRDGRVRGVVVRYADGAAQSSRPAPSCSPPAASRPTRSARRLPRPRTGTWPRCAARRTTPARSSRGARPRRAAYGHWSGCHAIQWDAGAPPTGDRELTNRYSRQSYPIGIVVNADGERFLDEGADFRNYTYASTAPRCCASRGASPPRSSTPAPRDAARDRLRGARRHARGRRHARDLAEGLASTPSASSAPSATSTPRSARRLRSDGQGRQGHRGSRRRSQLGAAGRRAAVRRLPGHVRDHLHFGGLRVDADARVLDRAGRPIRACSPRASSSAACSSTTTPAAAASPPGRCSGAGPATRPSGSRPTSAERPGPELLTPASPWRPSCSTCRPRA